MYSTYVARQFHYHQVWRARCVLFEEDVAIKVINLDKEDIDVVCALCAASCLCRWHFIAGVMG